MRWLCGGQTNGELVNNLFKNGLISSPVIRQAMMNTDRKNYLSLKKTFESAYEDMPLPLNDRVTISAPHMHAEVLEYLSDHLLRPGCRCLDVGSGSGYLVACLIHCILLNEEQTISDDTIRVVGIEFLRDLVDHSERALRREFNSKKLFKIIQGDGWKGAPDYAPFDVIHVGAAALEIPKKLIDQLAAGGRMVVPVGSQFTTQYLCIVDKLPDGNVKIQKMNTVSFLAPLINPDSEPSYAQEQEDVLTDRGSSFP